MNGNAEIPYLVYLVLVFAGWENKRTTLRRKRQDQELTFTYTDEILTKNCPLKLLIEITTGERDTDLSNNDCCCCCCVYHRRTIQFSRDSLAPLFQPVIFECMWNTLSSRLLNTRIQIHCQSSILDFHRSDSRWPGISMTVAVMKCIQNHS